MYMYIYIYIYIYNSTIATQSPTWIYSNNLSQYLHWLAIYLLKFMKWMVWLFYKRINYMQLE